MKTTIDVDRPAALAAARVLGTASLKDTVNAALREVLAAQRRSRLAERVRARALPVPTPDELARLRAPRIVVGGLAPRRGRRA
jgi:Arc/MetJ family transcription regulator